MDNQNLLRRDSNRNQNNQNGNNPPGPQQNNPVQNNPVQNQVQPQPQPQPEAPKEEEIKGRTLKTDNELKVRGKRVAADLKGSELWMRGSEEFKNAKSKYDRVQKLWAEYAAKENPTEEEARKLRGEMLNALYMADKYLGKKYEDKDTSKNATKRKDSMANAFNQLEEQIAVMDSKLEEIRKQPAPSVKKISSNTNDALKQMKDAKLFLRGSEEYDKALEEFEKAQKKMEALNKKYAGKEDQIPTTEIEDVREQFKNAREKLATYCYKKDGDVVKENTHKRVNASRGAIAVCDQTLRKMDELEEAWEKSPAKTNEQIKKDFDKAIAELDVADKLTTGSKEFKIAAATFYQSTKAMDKVIKAEAGGKELDFETLASLEYNCNLSEKKIDEYLDTKKGKKLSSTAQTRVDAMKTSKNAIRENRKMIKEKYKVLQEKAVAMTEENLGISDDKVVTNLKEYHKHVDGKRVWFGSQEFKDGMNAYDDVTRKAQERADSGKELSEKELKTDIEEYKKALEKMKKYIVRKTEQLRDKGKLDAKGKARLEEMRKAYTNTAIRIARAEAKLQAKDKKTIEADNRKIRQRVKDYDKSIRGKTGIDKISAMFCSNAAVTLERYGNQKSNQMTKAEIVGARRALATLLLEEKLKGKEGEKLKEAIAPKTLKNYSKMINQIANSKEFKELFPDNKINKETIRKIMSDPKELKRNLNTYNELVAKTGEKQKNKEANMEKNQTKNQEIEMQDLGKKTGPKK